MVAFFQARLSHVNNLAYDLDIADGIPKYIRIGCAQKDLKLYPNATPIYEIMVGLIKDDMIHHLGPRWINFFKSKCILGFRIRDMNGVYFMAVRVEMKQQNAERIF